MDNTADPEPLPKEKLIAFFNEAMFPIFPSQEELNALGLAFETSVQQETAEVGVNKPDADYLTKYFFEHSQCWRLFRIENWPL